MENADMLSRKSSGFEEAYAIERCALKLACGQVDSDQESLNDYGFNPDYFRKKARGWK